MKKFRNQKKIKLQIEKEAQSQKSWNDSLVLNFFKTLKIFLISKR